MIYPGLTYIGSNTFSALYGLHDTIIDQKACGLQHLYVDTYEKDLIHTATSVVKKDGVLYYADRVKPKVGHPKRHHAKSSEVIDYAIMKDHFVYDDFEKIDQVAAHETYIRFQTTIINTSQEKQVFSVGALAITQLKTTSKWSYQDGRLDLDVDGYPLNIQTDQLKTYAYIVEDAPSGFMYRGFQSMLFDEHRTDTSKGMTKTPLASVICSDITLDQGESYTFNWILSVKDQNAFEFSKDFGDVKTYWKDYLANINPDMIMTEEVKIKLVALKGALLCGLLPADLTGHYFANGHVAFYSRDALMGARAFLYAHLFDDFLSIIQFFLKCELKENGEYFQRYRFDQTGDEGANNDVFKQIDFIGYFASIFRDYYIIKGELLCDFETLDRILSILLQTEKKNGLYGPEGGVNEGVYGPAFITSTNMFICGGLKAALDMFDIYQMKELKDKWLKHYEDLHYAIEALYGKEDYYYYGYVDYHNDVIKRYDTPQLFGASFHYPLTNQYRASYNTLKTHASYYTYGIGYSEQEYHDGPWIFNTAAAAETAYVLGYEKDYLNFMEFMKVHQNGYGLLPEAIDAQLEQRPLINPLMWANAEFVCAAYMRYVRKVRNDV